MKTLILALLIMSFGSGLASAEIKGNIYQWQMDKYDWLREEFPDVYEKNLMPKDDVRGKSGDEIYQWQLKEYTWTQEEFDLPNL